MSAILLRIAIYGIIAGMLYFGIRSIVRDWRDKFRSLDKTRHERDIKERKRSDVVTLTRDSDGVFRPDRKDDAA